MCLCANADSVSVGMHMAHAPIQVSSCALRPVSHNGATIKAFMRQKQDRFCMRMIWVRGRCTYGCVQTYEPGIWHNAGWQAVHPTDRRNLLPLLLSTVRRRATRI